MCFVCVLASASASHLLLSALFAATISNRRKVHTNSATDGSVRAAVAVAVNESFADSVNTARC